MQKVVVEQVTKQLLMSTRNEIVGFRITEDLGSVMGTSVRANGLFPNIHMRFVSFFGGELRKYSDLIHQSSSEAVKELEQKALTIGADGVTNIRFQISNTADPISGIYSYAVVYGTAVKLKQQQPTQP